MATITNDIRRAVLEPLFNRQMAALKAMGLAREEEIRPLLPLLEQIGESDFRQAEGRTPIVIVPSSSGLTFSQRMDKVAYNGNRGVSSVDWSTEHSSSVPSAPYLMVDVEDGRATRGRKPSVCLKEFNGAEPRRFGGTALEGMTLAAYEPMILAHHFIDLPGFQRGADRVLCLCLVDWRQPWLEARADIAAPRFGSLSCGRRLGLAV